MLKVDRFDDVPENLDAVSWKVSERETLTVHTMTGVVVYPAGCWTRLEELPE